MKYSFLLILSVLTFSAFGQKTVPDVNISTLKGETVNFTGLR